MTANIRHVLSYMHENYSLFTPFLSQVTLKLRISLNGSHKQGVICCSGMCSSLPLADSEAEWGEGPCGDLLCGRPELQRLRRVLTLQDQ